MKRLYTVIIGGILYAAKATKRKRLPSRVVRRGIAATETAIILPVFVLVIFASIECANALYLKQSVTLAAYEAASILETDDVTMAEAHARCAEILGARDVQAFEMLVSPPLSTLSSGDVFTVSVSSPATAYSVAPSFFFQSLVMQATVSMVRN